MCLSCGDGKPLRLMQSKADAEQKGKQMAKEKGWTSFGIYWTKNRDKYVARENGHPRLELVETVYI